jgi:hypothetical protein
MGRGYSGNHPRFSKHKDESYDAKEAYNKDLTASARLHYLENDRHDHTSPMNNIGMVGDSVMGARRLVRDMDDYASDEIGFTQNPRFQDRFQGFAEDVAAPGGLAYENMQARANHADMRNLMGYDADLQTQYVRDAGQDLGIPVEDTGFTNSQFVESPMNKHNRSHRLREKAMNISERSGAERGDEYDYENPRVQKLLSKANKADERSSSEYESENRQKEMDSMMDERADSPFNACAKDDTKSDLQFQLAELVKLSSQEMTSTVRTKVVIQQMNKAIEQINRLQSQIEILEELK